MRLPKEQPRCPARLRKSQIGNGRQALADVIASDGCQHFAVKNGEALPLALTGFEEASHDLGRLRQSVHELADVAGLIAAFSKLP
ncbi:hypothetical protein [Microvirga arsenatis]|uniref:Uncharacterized protein n=1 Tax=Microvirga arsenatis TaxID=2692265 RepID=A0ABW9Z3A3_9HYPH|nr:hypothetical protein [Microvirga arsenatis]NBJ11188.1 hypothetical protein [Microvirga arsenatis]NBJ25461.1 hypothetical protein [Microvirga arsenatis]